MGDYCIERNRDLCLHEKKKIGRQDVSPAVGGGGLALCAVSEANGKLFLLAFSVRSLLLRAEAACRGVPACRAVPSARAIQGAEVEAPIQLGT